MENEREKNINIEEKIDDKVDEIIHRAASKDKIVDLYLKSDNLFEEYSGKSQLNDGIYEYLFKNTHHTGKKSKLQVRVHLDESINNEEEEFLKQNFKNEFIDKGSELKIEIRRNYFISLALLFIGIIFLIAYLISEYVFHFTLSEVISIICWVFIWEAADVFFLMTPVQRRKFKKIKKLYYSDIKFIRDKKDENIDES